MTTTRVGILRGQMLGLLAGIALFAPPVSAQPMNAQGIRADAARAIYLRAQRLVNDGQGTEGRALVDSMLSAAELRTPDEAEALFWRATLAESWELAQRDYLRIMLEHDRSARAGDAMLRLAQGEAARGDRDAALRYLERLVLEAPESVARAEGALWHGRLLLERGDRSGSCTVLRSGHAILRAGQLELENQYGYLLRECPALGATDSVPVATVAPTPTTSADTTIALAGAPAVSGAPTWSVQVAAVSTNSEANAMVRRLRERGYDVRIDGSVAPFRIRFGRFPTRAAAAAALEGYTTKEMATAFLVEVPRG